MKYTYKLDAENKTIVRHLCSDVDFVESYIEAECREHNLDFGELSSHSKILYLQSYPNSVFNGFIERSGTSYSAIAKLVRNNIPKMALRTLSQVGT